MIARFDSGNSHLDRFLKSSRAFDDSTGKTYVFLSDTGDCVIGYYNIGMGSVEQTDGDLRRKLGGAVHINCFAGKICETVKRSRIGKKSVEIPDNS